MKRYMIAFRLNENSKATTQRKEQVKMFEEEKEATSFVAGVISSETRELVSVSYHDFTTHNTTPYEPQLAEGRLKLVKQNE